MHPEYENVYGSRNQYDHYTVERQHMKALYETEKTESKSFVIAGNSSNSSKPLSSSTEQNR